MADTLKRSDIRRVKGLVAKYRAWLKDYHASSIHPSSTKSRVTIATPLPLGTHLAGEMSFPGPDVTFTPPPSNAAVVSLGCQGHAPGLPESIRVTWPRYQTPEFLATGSGQQRYSVVHNSPLTIVPRVFADPVTAADANHAQGHVQGFQNITEVNATYAVPTSGFPGDGQPSPITDNTVPDAPVANTLMDGVSTPFEHTFSTSTAYSYSTQVAHGFSRV